MREVRFGFVPGLPWWFSIKNLPANARDMGSIPGQGRSLGEGNGNPLQNSCLGNPVDGGAQQATVLWGSQRVRNNLATEQESSYLTLITAL